VPTYWLSVALAPASLFSVIIAARVHRLAPFPGRREFILFLLCIAWWTATDAFEHASDQVDVKVFWAKMAWFGVVCTPGYFGLFTWNYMIGQNRAASRTLHFVLTAIGLTVLVVALTDDPHHLIYTATTPIGIPPYLHVHYDHGPLYFILTTIFYLIMLLAQTLIFYRLIHASDFYRVHYLGMLGASLPPWLLNIAHLIGLFDIDATPFSFVLVGGIYYWMLSRRNLFDLVPIAQGVLLNAVPDPVLVVDAERRITECNPAARALTAHHPLIGTKLDAVPEFSGGLDLELRSEASPHEVSIGTPARHFDVVLVPLTYDGRAVGTLILLRDITDHREAQHRLEIAMVELERQLASNVELQRQLREEAIRDTLTGLHNRRFFDEIAPAMLADAQRAGAKLAAVMVDIDYFKRLNDQHGHAAGDAVLRHTGQFLRQNIRAGDAVFRMGGEEFLILMPNVQPASVIDRVDAWRSAFSAHTVEHEGVALNATFSAGFALYPEQADALDILLSRADAGLYRAKAEGRNRVCEWRDE
jgi:diguanylate cyclase (GGDEF)-like protein